MRSPSGLVKSPKEGIPSMTKTATKKAPAKKAKASKGARGPRNGPSRRSQQRLIALRMGLDAGTIKSEDLREACRKAGAYNAPNFKQDMKKEAALFNPIAKDGKTIAWKLTALGRKIAKLKAKETATDDAPKAEKVGKAPKASKTEKAPKAEKAGKAPKAEKAPKAAKVSKAPKASKAATAATAEEPTERPVEEAAAEPVEKEPEEAAEKAESPA